MKLFEEKTRSSKHKLESMVNIPTKTAGKNGQK
jgi:hypothetical protein